MDRRCAFDPKPDSFDELDPRTQRAYEDPMQVRLAQTGGVYSVYAASGTTYDVDVVKGTCTCPDFQGSASDGGCKYLRRVELEIRAKRVPTPDGRLPARPAADGGHIASRPGTGDGIDGRIVGPVVELDADGEPTGAEYFRCRACGREAMRKRDLNGCCDHQTP